MTAQPPGGGRIVGSATPLVLATRNPGKVAEFRRLLADRAWRVLDLGDAGVDAALDEPGPGYPENARAKAVAVCTMTGHCALADDSGIEVEALRGWPGPHSARWRPGSDAERLRGLLDEVARLCPDDRRVRYVAVVAIARPGTEALVARGSCEGRLVEPRGGAGFGYDPAFFSPELGKTFGEATAEEKDRVSHRARALGRLAESGLLDGAAASEPAV